MLMTEEKEWALATEATRDHFTLTPDKPEAQELHNFHLSCGHSGGDCHREDAQESGQQGEIIWR